jgi:hypothetical protein
MIKPTNDIPEKSEIEHIFTKKTKSLAGKSNLTFHGGRDEADNLYLRIWVNSSNGYFSNEWLAMSKIEDILQQQGNESFTSYVFKDLFQGKSSNSCGFACACLIAEGILAFAEGKKRKLVYTGNSLVIDKAKPRKKTARKSTSKSSK